MAVITTRAVKGAALTFDEVDSNFTGLNTELANLLVTVKAAAGLRNLLINGGFLVNQRGYTSGAATTTVNQYTVDRWRVPVSGQSVSWLDSGNVRTVTAPAGGIEQVVEGASLTTGTYVLNWTGTATATVAGASVTKGASISLTGGVNATVRFSGGTVSQPQLERGTVPTQFEQRHYGQELSLCQRYFYWQPINMLFYSPVNSASLVVPIVFPVPMRAAPTAAGNTVDPNATPQLENANYAYPLNLTPYGGGFILACNVVGNSYVLGYRSAMSAEF